jgi:hypothetical protein
MQIISDPSGSTTLPTLVTFRTSVSNPYLGPSYTWNWNRNLEKEHGSGFGSDGVKMIRLWLFRFRLRLRSNGYQNSKQLIERRPDWLVLDTRRGGACMKQ